MLAPAFDYSAGEALVGLAGGIALLLWGAALIKSTMLEGFEGRLRHKIAVAATGKWRSLLLGVGVACSVQSTLGAAILITSLMESGLFGLNTALTMMIGADLGVALVIQMYSLGPSLLAPAMILIGGLLPRLSDHPHANDAARVATGLGLIFLALIMIVGASAPLRASAVTQEILALIARDLALGLLVGALMTWAAHSSIASLLLISAMASVGAIELEGALALVIGANIGAGLIPFTLFARSSAASRRVIFANIFFRTATGLLLAPAVVPLASHLSLMEINSGVVVVTCHLGFNIVLVAIFLPLVRPISTRLLRWFPEKLAQSESTATWVDEDMLNQPQLARSAAVRHILMLLDEVQEMLEQVMLRLRQPMEETANELHERDDKVDTLQSRVAAYLVQWLRQDPAAEERLAATNLVTFSTNLKHVGDIMDRLGAVAEKKRHLHIDFSHEGWAKLEEMRLGLLKQLTLARAVLITGDLDVAKQLAEMKERIRTVEADATAAHFMRLMGHQSSNEASSIYLDVLRDLKRISAHIVSIAYPIAEASGPIPHTGLESSSLAARA